MNILTKIGYVSIFQLLIEELNIINDRESQLIQYTEWESLVYAGKFTALDNFQILVEYGCLRIFDERISYYWTEYVHI